MRSQVLAAFAAVLLASPLVAAENEAELDFGKDRFLAGETVTLDKAGVDDLFMAGETVRGESDISGSAHMAGRKVEMVGSVGGDAYLAGVDVRLKGKVSGERNFGRLRCKRRRSRRRSENIG